MQAPRKIEMVRDRDQEVKFVKIFSRNEILAGLMGRSLLSSESQKPRQRVSNADRKVFANPESFCDKFIIG